MWKAFFEDGSIQNSVLTYWTDLPKDKKIVKLWLASPKGQVRELWNMDSYYYVIEAVTLVGGGSSSAPSTIKAEIAGGINLESQTLKELRLNCSTDLIEVVTKPLVAYRYSAEILIPGKK